MRARWWIRAVVVLVVVMTGLTAPAELPVTRPFRYPFPRKLRRHLRLVPPIKASWSFVQAKDSGTVTTAGTSIAVTMTSAITQNNLLVACLGYGNNAATDITPPSGWLLASASDQETGAGTGANIWEAAMFYKVAGASESTTISFSFANSTQRTLCVLEYSGVDTSAPLDVADASMNYNGISSTFGAYTGMTSRPSYQDGLVVGHILSANKTGTPTLNGHGMSARNSGGISNNFRMWVADLLTGTSDLPWCLGAGGLTGAGGAMPGAIAIFKLSGASARTDHATDDGVVVSKRQGRGPFTGTATSVTTNYLSAPVAGNLLLVIFRLRTSGRTASAPAGWSNATPWNGADSSTWYWFYREAPDGTTGYTFTFSGSTSYSAWYFEFEGGSSWTLDIDPGRASSTHGHNALKNTLSATSEAGMGFRHATDREVTTATADQDGLWVFVSDTNSGRAGDEEEPSSVDPVYEPVPFTYEGQGSNDVLYWGAVAGPGYFYMRFSHLDPGTGDNGFPNWRGGAFKADVVRASTAPSGWGVILQ